MPNQTQNLNDSRLVLQLSLLKPLKPGVKSRMKMVLYMNRCVKDFPAISFLNSCQQSRIPAALADHKTAVVCGSHEDYAYETYA